VVAGVLALTTTIALLVIGRARGADVASVRRDRVPLRGAARLEPRRPPHRQPSSFAAVKLRGRGLLARFLAEEGSNDRGGGHGGD
jgi:hypothetical protein